MYRFLRYSSTLNKSYLPTSRQFSILPFLLRESEKAELIKEYENKIEKLKLINNLEIEKLTRGYLVEKNRVEWLNELEKKRLEKEISMKQFEKDNTNRRFEKEIAAVNSRLEKEIAAANSRLEKEITDRCHEKEIANKRLEKEITDRNHEKEIAAIKMGNLNLSYLRLKGAVHIRGVFEHWESFFLSNFEGNRITKWNKYLNANKDALGTFQKFYPNPDEININHVVAEIKSLYKWLSERIHNAHAAGDRVEWNRNSLTPVQNKVVEYMCKELHLKYQIVDEVDEHTEIT